MTTIQEAKLFLREKYFSKQKAVCPCCNCEVVVRKESLSKGLVDTLAKFYLECRFQGSNQLHLQTETDFTKNQYNNFQKLHYFGLVEKTDKTGVWMITTDGESFLFNTKLMPKCVYVFRNRVVESDGELVSFNSYKKYLPEEYWTKIGSYSVEQKGLF